jgi:hypothetical protein
MITWDVIFEMLQESWKWGKRALFCNRNCRLQFGIIRMFCFLKITKLSLSHMFCVIWIWKVAMDIFGQYAMFRELCLIGFTMNQLTCVLLYTSILLLWKARRKHWYVLNKRWTSTSRFLLNLNAIAIFLWALRNVQSPRSLIVAFTASQSCFC